MGSIAYFSRVSERDLTYTNSVTLKKCYYQYRSFITRTAMTKNIILGSLVTIVSTVILGTAANAENVEITLVDNLDGYLSSYCLDIKGGNRDVDPSNGLQAHTCYSYRGSLGNDQIFDSERFAENILYMPEYDVCAEISGLEAGATVGLAPCDNSSLQGFIFSHSGTISPIEASEMCLTAALDTRLGRGGTSEHQIKDLTLVPCNDDRAIFQQWRTRTLNN